MSTKAGVDHGDRHHLYAEMFEPGKVYLSLDGAEFTACPGGVIVAIPAEVWEKIRAHGIGEFSPHWMTPEEGDEGYVPPDDPA